MLSASPPKRKGTKVRPSSTWISADMTAPRPMPPWLSGVWTPKNPADLALSCSAVSSSAVTPRSLRRSRARTCCSSGMSSLVTNVRTQSRMSRSSLDRLRSMSVLLSLNGTHARVLAQLSLGQGVLVHLIRAVGEAQRPDAGKGGGELVVLAEARRPMGLDGLVEDPFNGPRRGDLDGLDLRVGPLVAHGVHE